MNPYKISKDLRAEGFDEEVISNVVVINGLHMSKKIRPRHIDTIGLYTQELKEKSRDVLWETTDKVFGEAWELSQIIYDYELTHSLNGLGGCVAKTYRELYFGKH